MISKTKINKRIKRKRNPSIVETLLLAKKNNHLELAKQLAAPTKKQKVFNLDFIDKLKEKKILIAGKILGEGQINKKISLTAINFSEKAIEKLKEKKCEIRTIFEELKINPKLKDIKIIK